MLCLWSSTQFKHSIPLSGHILILSVWRAAWLSQTPLHCTGCGFGVWVAGSVACGFAPNFWALLACRVVMGAGEASIITLTGPFIDDVAPPAQKTLWFGILNVVRACLVGAKERIAYAWAGKSLMLAALQVVTGVFLVTELHAIVRFTLLSAD